jgi:hypothetical protein
MANTLIVKRSAVEGKTPLTTDLQLGELAINTYDGKLFLKRNDGVTDFIVEVGGNTGFDVKNQTGTTIPKGTLVKFAGTLGASGKLLVAPFLANGTDPSDYVVGIVQNDIIDGGDGFAIDHGKLFNINTSAWAEGTILYASPTVLGGLTDTIPTAPNNKITVAAVINSSTTAGVLEVRITLGSRLGNDELVELSGLADNDILAFNNTNNRFENTAVKTVNGISLFGSGDIETGGSGLAYSVKTANYTAVPNEYILADTSTAGFTITLPATPVVGNVLSIADYAGTFGANNITVDRNGSTIEDSATNINLSISKFEYTFVYTGTTWKVFSKQNLLGVTSSVYLSGPTVGNEGTDIQLAIQGWTLGDSYAITVSGGSYVRNTDLITWTLPSVVNDTMHNMTIQVNGGSSYTHDVYVINIPTTTDTSISLTDFSVNSSNNGWTV